MVLHGIELLAMLLKEETYRLACNPTSKPTLDIQWKVVQYLHDLCYLFINT